MYETKDIYYSVMDPPLIHFSNLPITFAPLNGEIILFCLDL